ncbi:tetratricopeptide repeat protein [Hydrogenimonas urashimensis]|uniref:tetratricopeptide repeat protein n=1 Tax=Hydrogenimonas urashimensis TaxID=2740515 RepID=UPI0019163CC3|nr:tetratricopeptide repeat protein [Hydrogenimonas urashimensis]
MKHLFTAIVLAAAVFAAAPEEPSAFGAGNLDSPNPYGLSEEEKHILKNKQAIEALQKSLLKQQAIVRENRERIDGLQSIIEGLNDKIRSYDKAVEKIDDLNRTVDQLVLTQEENFEQIRKVLQELGAMIDSINEKYVDKERFDKLESAFLAFKNSYESFMKKGDLSGRANADIFVEAKKLFSKKRYSDAKIYFSHLIKNHYKPATSNYYLGEIAYREGRYKDAIAYYKKSASLYDKSSFMPTLLLHTAVSFERLGEKKQAKQFYDSLIQLYPDSKSAKIAGKNLSKLK